MSLVLHSKELIRFRSGDNRWVDLRRFLVEDDVVESAELMSKLVEHPEYRDGYMGAGPGDDAAIHGRFRLSAISAASFMPCRVQRVTDCLAVFLAGDGAPPATNVVRQIDQLLLDRVRASGVVYELVMSAVEQHDVAWVLDEFREFVFVSSDLRELMLIVLGAD